jgi:hypothetical protein
MLRFVTYDAVSILYRSMKLFLVLLDKIVVVLISIEITRHITFPTAEEGRKIYFINKRTFVCVSTNVLSFLTKKGICLLYIVQVPSDRVLKELFHS